MMSSTILGDDVLHFITTISSKFCKHLGDLSQGWVKKYQHFALQVFSLSYISSSKRKSLVVEHGDGATCIDTKTLQEGLSTASLPTVDD